MSWKKGYGIRNTTDSKSPCLQTEYTQEKQEVTKS